METIFIIGIGVGAVALLIRHFKKPSNGCSCCDCAGCSCAAIDKETGK